MPKLNRKPDGPHKFNELLLSITHSKINPAELKGRPILKDLNELFEKIRNNKIGIHRLREEVRRILNSRYYWQSSKYSDMENKVFTSLEKLGIEQLLREKVYFNEILSQISDLNINSINQVNSPILKDLNILFEKVRAGKIKDGYELEKEIEEVFYKYKLHFSDFEFMNSFRKEILITEFFVNRISKLTKRPIVVVGIASTGVPYTWSIKPDGKKVIVDKFKYPSSNPDRRYGEVGDGTKTRIIVNTFMKFINNYKQEYKDPVFIFVDASDSKKMPASFVGYSSAARSDDWTYMQYPIRRVLSDSNINSKLIGYDWSMRDGTKQLPSTLKLDGENKIDAILFNPSKGRQKESAYPNNNDVIKNPAFRDLILAMVDNYKKHRFEKEKE
ncbi:MAG: hypothetical protein WCX82_01775 [archaeon]|jgi:hypothetical protein